VHFGGSIVIRIALLLTTLGSPCSPSRNVFDVTSAILTVPPAGASIDRRAHEQ
jgi:hypothetical protein